MKQVGPALLQVIHIKNKMQETVGVVSRASALVIPPFCKLSQPYSVGLGSTRRWTSAVLGRVRALPHYLLQAMLEGTRRSAILAVNIARRARKDAARHGREGGFLVLDTPSQTWDSKFVIILFDSVWTLLVATDLAWCACFEGVVSRGSERICASSTVSDSPRIRTLSRGVISRPRVDRVPPARVSVVGASSEGFRVRRLSVPSRPTPARTAPLARCCPSPPHPSRRSS